MARVRGEPVVELHEPARKVHRAGLDLHQASPHRLRGKVTGMMDLFETIRARQSVRAYQDKGIEAGKLEAILSAANQSPSAGNLQAYEIVLVREKSLILKLTKATFNQDFISQAPVVLVFCSDTERSGAKYGEAGKRLFCVQDATIATAYAQLAATALGLATCWIGAFTEQRVIELLGLKEGLRPVAILPIGWPAETPERTTRRGLPELVREIGTAGGR